MADLSLAELTALEIATRVCARDVSPVAVVEAHLEAIARHNPAVNAVVTLAADQALDEARALEKRLAVGAPVGPLAGVPLGVKDIHPTKGLRTTYGAPIMRDHVPDADALIVARARAADAIVIGKTNVPEFAFGAHTVNPIFGVTRNPWDTRLSASGSTGGGAAGLATRMFALATGSDLGGGVRTPAAFCGVVGIRPSPGLIPAIPTMQPWDMLAVDGPMARNVADAAALLQAVAGPDARIPMIVPIEGRDFVAAAKAVPRAGLRIGYCPDIARIGVDPEIERVARQAAFALRDHGCVVEECDLDLSLAKKAFLQLRGQFAINHFVGMLDKVDRFGANVANNIRYGLAQSPKDVAEGVRGQMEILARMNTFFERFDRLITPTTCVPPFPVEMNHPESVAGRKLETYIDWVAPTFALSMTALPVVAVPAGLDRSGLPVGVQIVAPRGNEEGALTVAAAVERAAAMPKPGITERV